MHDNQLSGTDFGKFPTGFLTIQVFHQLKVSYLCVFNCFSQIAIDVPFGLYKRLRGLFFSKIELCTTQFIVVQIQALLGSK